MPSSNAPLKSPPANDAGRSSTSDSKADKEDKNPENENKATEELSVVIDDLLNQLGTKFNAVSEELLNKMDEMARRLDNLEAAIQAGNSADAK